MVQLSTTTTASGPYSSHLIVMEALGHGWVSQAAEPNEVEFSSRWILGDFYGAGVDGAFFLMDSLAQVQGFDKE